MDKQKPLLNIIEVSLPLPSLTDQRSDEARLRQTLEKKMGSKVRLPLSVLKKLPNLLRKYRFSLQVICAFNEGYWEILDVRPPKDTTPVWGLAVDLGSTSIVFYVYDFRSQRVFKKHSFKNPQIRWGEDILHRLHYARKPERKEELKALTLSSFNQEIKALLAPLLPQEVLYYFSISGNTTMSHFLLGLETNHLFREPYIPTFNWLEVFRAQELGLISHPEALLFVFPNGGSYFGGDLLAGILASGLHKREEICLLIDVGTNAEVVLGNKDFLLACAGAAGPALEGGILSCGMQAASGAIERVRIDPETLEITYKTIDNKPPIGICGSGVIDLLAQMFLAGLLDQRGKFVVSRCPYRFRNIKGEKAFFLVTEEEAGHGQAIFIQESEIKSIIRSKGAMYTILTVLCESVGVSFAEIDKIFIAGSFGNYIDPEMAITIGMLPDVPRDRFVSLGNAAGQGALYLFQDSSAFKKLKDILHSLTYLEMNVQDRFMHLLTGALFLPHTNLDLFPSVAQRLGLKKIS